MTTLDRLAAAVRDTAPARAAVEAREREDWKSWLAALRKQVEADQRRREKAMTDTAAGSVFP